MNRVGFCYHPDLPGARTLAEQLAMQARKRGSEAWLAALGGEEVDRTLAEQVPDSELVVCVGGDGTVLHASEVAARCETPIFGVRIGRLGFLCEVTGDEAPVALRRILDGEVRSERRAMVQARLADGDSGEQWPAHALNDVVVSRGAVPRLLDIDVRVSGTPLTTYRADGVIVSTATGSTGYALAAGGPTLYPEAREILIQPVATHMGLQAGLIVPEDSVVELTVHADDDAGLSVDSFTDASLSRGDRVVVQRSPYEARFLRAGPPSDFYRTVTQRFGILDRPARNR